MSLAVAVVVALWVIDAYVQMITGYSLGGAAEAERLSGIFGAGNLKLGPVLAVLSPFVLVAARDRFGWRGLAFAFVFLLVPILLAGSRAAWLMYALVSVVVAWRETRSKRHFALAITAGALLMACVATLALPRLARVSSRASSAACSRSAAPRAPSMRLRPAGSASGKRRFRCGTRIRSPASACADSATPIPRTPRRRIASSTPTSDTGASHAHQIVLEVLSETGAIGLLFWLAGAGFAVRAWRRASAAARERAFAPALALVAMTFPLNTHLAFYSAWWGLLFWWLLALYCAALGARGDADA